MTPMAIRWIAGVDRIGHASRRGNREYLCGRKAIDERYAWPKQSRCSSCEAALAAEQAV